MSYAAPVADMRFVLNQLGLLQALRPLPGSDEWTPDLVDAILEEAAKLAGEVLAPLNREGDMVGARLENGVVRTAPGFADAYRAYVEGGWNAVPFDPAHGGQGLPWSVAVAVQEMWQSANLSWGLCPLLNLGAVEAIHAHGSAEQQALYLPKLVSGEWTGTMNLTEPQAGSDLSQIRTRAERDGAAYRITGQKIYITYGEHDMTDNIVHLVLARLPDAPSGTKGISLFIVPKFLVNADGSPGARNDVRVVSLEHKLGINASPTCVMAYGDDGGAIGYLVGEENRGLEYMFTMMNSARLHVGLQGLAIAERAYQQARAYARERQQGRGPAGQSGPILHHPDVRRMLLTMRATAEAMRGLIYDTMAALDLSKGHPDAEARAWAQARVDLLTPVVKGWCTDMGVEMASIGVQIHGGMGFIEETGAAQHYRDARILPIYEGTNGIQAIDLMGRKLLRDEGAAFNQYLEEAWSLINRMNEMGGADIARIRARYAAAVDALDQAGDWLIAEGARDRSRALAGATPFLRLFGLVAGGTVMVRSALAAHDAMESDGVDTAALSTKLKTALFYCETILPQAA